MKKEVLNLNGYRVVYCPGHFRAMRGTGYEGYVYEHVLVAEEFLGRSLTDDEVVHHLDLNRANNRKSNLLVLLSGQHSKLHYWLSRGCPMVSDPQNNFLKKSSFCELDIPVYCSVCDRCVQSVSGKYCSFECYSFRNRKCKSRPSKKELEEDIRSMTWTAMGVKYGVSSSAVKKWAVSYGIVFAPRRSLSVRELSRKNSFVDQS